MLRVAVPNKGSLSDPAIDLLTASPPRTVASDAGTVADPAPVLLDDYRAYARLIGSPLPRGRQLLEHIRSHRVFSDEKALVSILCSLCL